MRSRSASVVLASALVILSGTKGVAACTGEQPSFEQAVSDASAIVRVQATEPPGDSQAVSILSVLKGTVQTPLMLDAPQMNLCGDRLTLPAGSEAIVAYDVPYFETLLTVAWMETGDPVVPILGSAHPPDDATSLDDVEAAILAELPNAAVPQVPPITLPMLGWGMLALALVSAFARVRRATW
jgi:hypothetical protein